LQIHFPSSKLLKSPSNTPSNACFFNMSVIEDIWNGVRWGTTTLAGGTIEILGDASIIIGKATDILRRANDASVGRLVGEILQRFGGSSNLINPDLLLDAVAVLMNKILQAAQENAGSVKVSLEKIVDHFSDLIILISPDLLLNTAKKLTKFILSAVIEKVGSLPALKDGIFSNEINAATLVLIRDQAAEFAKFLLDLLEAAKCYARADSKTGRADANEPHGRFNELDFEDPMNRHATISQIQRLAFSVISILRRATESLRLEDIDMTPETSLMSDYGIPSGSTITTKPANGYTQEEAPKVQDEKWLFVNGIAGEQYWLRLACNKLKAAFSRDVTGVFNRGDGILWDIIECAGERSTYTSDSTEAKSIVSKQRTLIQRTTSSRNAQKALEKELEGALEMADQLPHTKIIVIAHSQGCLLLRHVLEDLVADAVDNPKRRDTMQHKLCVFTFGNPSLHWKAHLTHPVQGPSEGQTTLLNSHVLRTEHFANKKDFVAKLGLLSDENFSERGYAEDEVFINGEREWIGHLFGTQYSLNPDHYRDPENQPNGSRSYLLTCKNGVSMDDARSEFLRAPRPKFRESLTILRVDHIRGQEAGGQ